MLENWKAKNPNASSVMEMLPKAKLWNENRRKSKIGLGWLAERRTSQAVAASPATAMEIVR